jgi:hypothetical protein
MIYKKILIRFIKKIIHSALPSGLEALRAGSGGVGFTSRRLIIKGLGEKLPDPSLNYHARRRDTTGI